jgi:hypothetical protein
MMIEIMMIQVCLHLMSENNVCIIVNCLQVNNKIVIDFSIHSIILPVTDCNVYTP